MTENHLNLTGNILRIERSSIHDGSGLRTVVFLKGCPLRCSWCSTPESKDYEFEKGFAAELCVACGQCASICQNNAIRIDLDNNVAVTDRSKCGRCLKCADVCASNAVKSYGKIMTVSEVMDEIKKDEIFFYYSGGGITLSGGEPICQSDFSAALLRESRLLGINTALESCLYGKYKSIEKLLPWLDTLYADLKHMDSGIHRKWTGEDNRWILENLVKVNHSNYSPQIIVRIPLVPGFNDSDENLLATLQFCKGLDNLKGLEILPYHRLGVDTYRYLDLCYQCCDIPPPTAEWLSNRIAFLNKQDRELVITTGSGFNVK